MRVEVAALVVAVRLVAVAAAVAPVVAEFPAVVALTSCVA